MQFKTKHSHGPFEVHFEDGDWFILDANGRIIAETWGADNEDMSEANRNLFYAAPSMLEYMMDRANCIEKEICLGVCYDPDGSKEELQTILSILKDVGMEVIE